MPITTLTLRVSVLVIVLAFSHVAAATEKVSDGDYEARSLAQWNGEAAASAGYNLAERDDLTARDDLTDRHDLAPRWSYGHFSTPGNTNPPKGRDVRANAARARDDLADRDDLTARWSYGKFSDPGNANAQNGRKTRADEARYRG